MTTLRNTLKALFLALGLIGGSYGTWAAIPSRDYIVVENSDVFLLKQPHRGADRLTHGVGEYSFADKGEHLPYLGQENEYYKTLYQADTCYIATRYCTHVFVPEYVQVITPETKLYREPNLELSPLQWRDGKYKIPEVGETLPCLDYVEGFYYVNFRNEKVYVTKRDVMPLLGK